MPEQKQSVKQKQRKPRAKSAKKTPKGALKLTVQERRHHFVEAYLQNGGNASQAAIAAGFSAATAGQQGSRLLKHVQVAAQIEQRRDELAKKFSLTTEAVLKNLTQTILFDPRKLYREDGSLKPIPELDDDTAMALAGFEVVELAGGMAVGEGGVVKHVPMYSKKVKWLDKNVARDQANRILGQYKKDNDQTKPVTRVIVVPAKDKP